MKTGTDIVIERVMARRKAAGLLVSTDRDAFIARAERNGLNPRVEAA